MTANQTVIKQQLAERLKNRSLKPQSIVCLPSGRRYKGTAVIRCNVNFGDPHVAAYCSVLADGKFLTRESGNRATTADDPPIPCGPDRRGREPPVETFE